MMNIGPKKKSEGIEEVCIDAIMDSGACDTITSMDKIGGNEVKQTRASKRGMNYYGPDGSVIKNRGESSIKGTSHDGIPIELTAPIGDNVKKLLISISNVTKAGNMVIFGAVNA